MAVFSATPLGLRCPTGHCRSRPHPRPDPDDSAPGQTQQAGGRPMADRWGLDLSPLILAGLLARRADGHRFNGYGPRCPRCPVRGRAVRGPPNAPARID